METVKDWESRIIEAVASFGDITARWEQLKVDIPDVEKRRPQEETFCEDSAKAYSRIKKLLSNESIPKDVGRTLKSLDDEWHSNRLAGMRICFDTLSSNFLVRCKGCKGLFYPRRKGHGYCKECGSGKERTRRSKDNAVYKQTAADRARIGKEKQR